MDTGYILNSYTITDNMMDVTLTQDGELNSGLLQFCNESMSFVLIARVDYFDSISEMNEDDNEYQTPITFSDCTGRKIVLIHYSVCFVKKASLV